MSATSTAGDPVLRFDGFVLDVAHRSLRRADREVALRPRSFDVLAYLAGAAGRVVGKDELLAALWPGVVVTEDSLTRCISDIRRALGDDDQHVIKTLPRRGYVFVAALGEAEQRVVDAGATRDGADGARCTNGADVAAGAGVAHAPAAFARAAVADTWSTVRPARPARQVWMAGLALGLFLLAGVSDWRWVGSDVPAPRLSIVVLPLVSRDAGDAQSWLADAMTEEITVDLSRIPEATVIARGSAESYRGKVTDARRIGRELGVRYVLEGQFEHADEAVRLLLQLVDAGSARVLWVERIEGERRDLAGLRRRVTAAVANSLQVRLAEVDSSRTQQLAAPRPDARDLALQAWSLGRRYRSPQAVQEQRDLAQRAIALDANLALAWATLAHSYTQDLGGRYLHLRGATREQWLQHAVEAADRAWRLDANDSRVIITRAHALSLQGRAEEALTLYERAIALNRNDAIAWFGIGYAHGTLGRTQEAITAAQEAMRLSPRDANLSSFYLLIAAAHLFRHEDRESLEWARRSALERPDFFLPHAWVASSAALAGDAATAQPALATLRRLMPTYTVAAARAEGVCANAVCESRRERFYEGLQRAGLPD
jgi:TolB-like protein/DNA-binding winged helix-turn-helix (wHTH) protein